MSDRRKNRQAEIEAAALTLLERDGPAALTMSALARRVNASNETLYNWYGDRTGLFRALVRRNTELIRARLRDATAVEQPALQTLTRLGAELLGMLTSNRVVALNRVAASDPSNRLGREIALGGRATIVPMVAEVVANVQSDGDIGPAEIAEITEVFLDLLIGDIQTRRVIGALDPMDTETISRRAGVAVTRLQTLYPGAQIKPFPGHKRAAGS